jgi:hypothetical protein
MTDSGYTDSGWAQSSAGSSVNQNGETSWTFSDTKTDVYNVLSRPGVFLINGSKGNISSITPIYCSVDDLNNIGSGLQNSDDAYLVYPDYGFRLFQSTGYTGTVSNIYFNTTNKPILFLLGGINWGNSGEHRVYLKDQQGTGNYPQNSTESIRIFHRSYVDSSTSYKISGLSGSTT